MSNFGPRYGTTRARVHRASEDQAFVTLDDWYAGQILVHVPAYALERVCPRALWLLPETEFTVTADLEAAEEDSLDLRGWCVHLPLSQRDNGTGTPSHLSQSTTLHQAV